VPGRRTFLLRMDPAVHEALQRWAEGDLRSLNGQIEYLLRKALMRAGRMKGEKGEKGERGEKREHGANGESW